MLKPGRELDALVAEKVMGYDQEQIRNASYYINEAGQTRHDIPSFSTDIAAAWEVVEKFRKADPTFTIDSGSKGYLVDFGGDAVDTARTLPHAICLAALRSAGA